MPDKRLITADLTGLALTEEQYTAVQEAVHRTVMIEVAKLPTFNEGISIRPSLGGGIPDGIILDNLKNVQVIGH